MISIITFITMIFCSKRKKTGPKYLNVLQSKQSLASSLLTQFLTSMRRENTSLRSCQNLKNALRQKKREYRRKREKKENLEKLNLNRKRRKKMKRIKIRLKKILTPLLTLNLAYPESSQSFLSPRWVMEFWKKKRMSSQSL